MEITDHPIESFSIPSTNRTPAVVFDLEESYLSITGISIPENPAKFYQPINNILEHYHVLRKDQILIELDLLHMSSSTLKAIYYLCKRINRLSHVMDVNINWYCSKVDDDMIEIIRDIRESLELRIRICYK